MDTRLFERIGFTAGETKVYFALLGLGSTTSGPIITKSQVASSKVYEILKKLEGKGLVSESIKSGTKYFQATSPERIMDYITQKENELKNEKIEFSKVLPQLKSRQKFQDQSQEAKVYVGFEGARTFYNDVVEQLVKGEEYLAMTFPDKALEDKTIIHFFYKFHKNRAAKGIIAKIISNEKDKLTQEKMDFSSTGLYEFRTTKQTIPAGIAIFNDTVATFNWGKTPRVFAVICKENAEQYRKFFYEVWNAAK